MTGNWDYKNLGETFNRPIRALFVSFIFFIGVATLISESEIFIQLEKNFNESNTFSSKEISKSLFNDWFLLLEIASILLLGTIVGCLTLLKFRKEIK